MGVEGAGGERQFRLPRESAEPGRDEEEEGIAEISDPPRLYGTKENRFQSLHPLLTQAACCCHSDGNTHPSTTTPRLAVWSPVKGEGAYSWPQRRKGTGRLLWRWGGNITLLCPPGLAGGSQGL